MSELINGLEVTKSDKLTLKVTNPDTHNTLYLHREDLEKLLDKLPNRRRANTPPFSHSPFKTRTLYKSYPIMYRYTMITRTALRQTRTTKPVKEVATPWV
jgi:hypothetical protein